MSWLPNYNIETLNSRYYPSIYLGLLCLLFGKWVAAEEKPLWELGVGTLALNMSEYRGSERKANHLLPFPYFIYRGEILKVEREGVRGIFYQSPRWQLDLSLDGGVPVESSELPVRRNMPDLDPMLEIGPSVRYQLHKRQNWTLGLRFPWRLAHSVSDEGIHYRGWLLQPQIEGHYRFRNGWQLGAQAGALYGNRRYHAYYYDVAPKHALPGRPAYQAEAGYSGARFSLGASRVVDRWRIGLFARYDNLRGAVFEDSPLVEQNYSTTLGLAVAYVFKRSRRTIPSRE